MIKALLFDLDGTLVDTHQANYLAYNRALEEVGVVITYEEFKTSIGHQANVFLRWFAPNLSDEEYASIAQSKALHYRETARQSVPNEMLIDLLRIAKQHCKIILVTTAKRQNAQVVLEHHGLSGYFDDIICSEDVEVSKPSPECYHLALKRNKLLPSEVLAFEDSLPGVEAAEKAGIAVLMVRDFVVS